MQQFIPLILMGVLMYALLIRPQRKRAAAQQALLSSIAVGDRVMTTSGLYGVVMSETDEVLVIGVAPGVDLHVVRAAVARKVADDAPGAPSVDDLVGVYQEEDPEELLELGPGTADDRTEPPAGGSNAADNGAGHNGEAA